MQNQTLGIGGYGIRRYELDYHLAKLGQQRGIQLIEGKEVRNIRFDGEYHRISCKDKSEYNAKLVIGAYGKRAGLDKALKREFFHSSSTYIGVKALFRL